MSTELSQKTISSLKHNHSGGYTQLVKIAGTSIAVTATTYASGDVLGTGNPVSIETVRAKNGTAILHSLVIKDLSKQNIALNMVVFDSNPTSTTFTNDSALDIADADIDKVIGVVSIASTDYVSFSDNSVATKSGIGLPIQNYSSGTTVWVAFVTAGAPTYAANELSATIGFLQD